MKATVTERALPQSLRLRLPSPRLVRRPSLIDQAPVRSGKELMSSCASFVERLLRVVSPSERLKRGYCEVTRSRCRRRAVSEPGLAAVVKVRTVRARTDEGLFSTHWPIAEGIDSIRQGASASRVRTGYGGPVACGLHAVRIRVDCVE
jgi:hypothetical protein